MKLELPPLDAPEWTAGPSGMRVWDVKEGTGAVVPKGATIKLHYTGWLPNGTIFDSSKQRNEPITFGLGQLIKGWQEGVPGMKVGGVRRLELPYQLAYGERGAPPSIPPKATLIFEIEVLELK
jgi:FKBP-type peptidyl-prolyl cis-trans isomerase